MNRTIEELRRVGRSENRNRLLHWTDITAGEWQALGADTDMPSEDAKITLLENAGLVDGPTEYFTRGWARYWLETSVYKQAT